MNKSKLVGAVAGALIVVLSAAGAYKYGNSQNPTPAPAPNVVPVNPAPVVVDPNGAVAKITAPVTANCGDLVVVNAEESSAKAYAWQVTPTTKNFRVDKDGHQAVLTSRTPGEYVVTVAVAKADTVDVKSVTIKFVGGDTSDIAGKVTEWASKVDSKTKRDDALKLGQSFLSVAAALQTGSVTPQTIVEATKNSNKEALGGSLEAWQKPFLEPLAVELKAQATAGKLVSPDAHIQMWKAIGNALKDYASTL